MTTAVFPIRSIWDVAAPLSAPRPPLRRRRRAMGPATIRAVLRELPDPEATVRVPPTTKWGKESPYGPHRREKYRESCEYVPSKPYVMENYDSGAVEEITLDSSDSDSAMSEDGISIGPVLLPVFQATSFGSALEGKILPAHVVKKHRAALLITPQPRTLCPVSGVLLLDVQLYNLAVLDLLVKGGYLTRHPALITAFRRASIRLVELLRRLGDAFALRGASDDGHYEELERLKVGTMLLASRVCQTAKRLMQAAA